MRRVFSKSFRDSLRNSRNSVELAGSGVTNVFPSTREKSSGPSEGARWLKHFAAYLWHKGRGNIAIFSWSSVTLGPDCFRFA